MIKFLATDLDGTLLDGQGHLPEEIFPLISALHGRGILFAPASGRQYANLETLFAPVKEEVLFLCENGALVKYRGKTLRMISIPVPLLRDALCKIRAIPHVYPVLCGADCAYIEDDAEPFRTLSFLAYTNCMQLNSLDAVVGKDEICKIALFDEISAENCMKVLPDRLQGLCTIISGKHWCDAASPEANKGEAVKAIQTLFGFKREECAAFGDHMNDYEMLAACGRAYVPENGYPPLVGHIGSVIPANTEGGVLKKIKEILEERS